MSESSVVAWNPRRASGSGHGYGPELLDEMTATKAVRPEPVVPRRATPDGVVPVPGTGPDRNGKSSRR